ncbi:MAG: class I SAM-dependent methyltransferase [Cyclobacteriaceae bacterium]
MKHVISWVIRKIPRKYLQLFSHYVVKILALFYIGNKVTCTVCNRRFRKFLPYGRKPRENALCPNCLALERHRLLYLYLQRKTNFFTASLKMLHIAPEMCFLHRFEAMKNLDYITADLESPLAKVKMDIHQIPFAENTFDVVFCNHVMEHVDDDLKAMREIYRVLKPGGWAIIQSPQDYKRETTLEDPEATTAAQREKLHGQNDHLRTYGADYPKRLSKAGFQVTEDDFVKTLPEDLVKKHALPGEEIIYYCRKY